MNSRERFQACCQGKTLDRAPIDYLAHHELDRRLKTHLGVNSESELLDALGCDFFYLPARDLSQREDFLPYDKHADRLELTDAERTCPLGIRWRREVRAAKFSVDEAICGPLQDTTDPQHVLRFPWPKAGRSRLAFRQAAAPGAGNHHGRQHARPGPRPLEDLC